MMTSNIYFCDYDVLTHYSSGMLNSKYKTDLTGKLQEIDKIIYNDESIISGFKNGEYNSYITLDDLILYRIFGQFKSNIIDKIKGARANGAFVSTEFAESLIDAKQRLALDPSWMNTKVYEAKMLLPKGSEISLGIVAPVVTKSGTVLEGGAEQIHIPKGWSMDMIIGYRRVTSRQLLNKPYFSIKNKPDFDTIKKDTNIYKPVCPACGCDDICILSDKERFTVVGKMGGVYEMKFNCKNSECRYYW